MMRNYKFIILGLLLSALSILNVYAQGAEDELTCLQYEYQADSDNVLLNCRPQNTKGIKGDISWMVVSLDKNDRPKKIIDKAIVKKGRKTYFVPKVVYDKHPNEEVMVVFTISDGSKGISYRHKLKVTL